MEIVQHIYQFKLPITYEPPERPPEFSRLFKKPQETTTTFNVNGIMPQKRGSGSFVNVYFIENGQDTILIDTGLNTSDSYTALSGELKHYGFGIKDVKKIIITHSHFDHCGQAGKLKELSSAQVIISASEATLFSQQYAQRDERSQTAQNIIKTAGVPASEQGVYNNVFKTAINLVTIFEPDVLVKSGDAIDAGTFKFMIIETPGHSPGHICLYEPNRKFLFTGDLILPEISPNIGFYPGQGNNPLADYFKSLELIYELEVNLAFPGHGPAFSGLRQIIEATVRHHETRNRAIIKKLEEKSPRSAWDIAHEIPWNNDAEVEFNSLNIFDKRLALGEATSHLEYLVSEGQIKKRIENDIDMYYG